VGCRRSQVPPFALHVFFFSSPLCRVIPLGLFSRFFRKLDGHSSGSFSALGSQTIFTHLPPFFGTSPLPGFLRRTFFFFFCPLPLLIYLRSFLTVRTPFDLVPPSLPTGFLRLCTPLSMVRRPLAVGRAIQLSFLQLRGFFPC